MPRYIMINDASGYVWGDTGSPELGVRDETAAEACQRLDASLGEYGCTYEEYGPRRPVNGQSAYHVYWAEPGCCLPVVSDGQDQAQITMVEQRATKVAVVLLSTKEESQS